MSAIEQAGQLLQMAAKDIKALDLMILPESIDDEIFGFHAQQNKVYAAATLRFAPHKLYLLYVNTTYEYRICSER